MRLSSLYVTTDYIDQNGRYFPVSRKVKKGLRFGLAQVIMCESSAKLIGLGLTGTVGIVLITLGIVGAML